MQVLGDRVLVVAFEGWNDAAEAATTATDAMREQSGASVGFQVNSEDYFDYQYTRPLVKRHEDGTRTLVWPGATLYRPSDPFAAGELWFLRGQEPARRWQQFTNELVAAIKREGITGVILLGALLADVPHTRPILVQGWSENEMVRGAFDVERSRYEGPVGILSVLSEACEEAGIPTLSEWASLPHYLSMQTSSPKGALALIDQVTELTGATFQREDIEAQARKWEASIDGAMSDDPDMVEYIRTLEQARDAWDTPAAKGDAIAREFEQFLRRGGEGPQGGSKPGR